MGRGRLGAVAGAEEELPGGDDLLCRPARVAVGLVEVRLCLEHDERLGRVDAHVLRQAAGIQELLPTGIAGVKDLRVGVCQRREEHTQKWGRRWGGAIGGASPIFPVFPEGLGWWDGRSQPSILGLTCFLHLLHRFGDLSFKCFGLIRRHCGCHRHHCGDRDIAGNRNIRGAQLGRNCPSSWGSCPVLRLEVAPVGCEAAQTWLLHPGINLQCLWGFRTSKLPPPPQMNRPFGVTLGTLKLHLMDKLPFQDCPKAPKLLPRDKFPLWMGFWDPLGCLPQKMLN